MASNRKHDAFIDGFGSMNYSHLGVRRSDNKVLITDVLSVSWLTR